MKTTGSRASAVSQTRGFGDLLYDKAGARPSLDLDFAGTSSLRDKITGEYLVDHTRTTTGTYINSEGLIKKALTNLYPGTKNLATTGLWSPDNGTEAASTFTNPIANGGEVVKYTRTQNIWGRFRVNPSSITNTLTYTASVYAKADGLRYLHLRVGQSGERTGTAFDLQEGVVLNQGYFDGASLLTSPTSASIEDAGDGWFRCIITFTNISHTSTWYYPSTSPTTTSDAAGNGQSQHYCNPQFVEGTVAGKFIPVFANTVNSAPRFTHERVETGNLIGHSETLGPGSGWNQSNLDVRQSYAIKSPSGEFDGTFIKSNTSNAFHNIIKNNLTVKSGKDYTLSAHFKLASGTNFGCLRLFDGANYIARASFTLTGSGSVSVNNGFNGEITALEDGWYRCSITGTSTTDSSAAFISLDINSIFVHNGLGHSLYVWGAQFEQASAASTYVPSIDTFTSRASSATYVDSAGLIKKAALNEMFNSMAPYHHSHTTSLTGVSISLPSTAPTRTNPFGNQTKVKTVVATSSKPDFTITNGGTLGVSFCRSNQFIRMGGGRGGLSISGNSSSNVVYTFSFYVRSNSGDTLLGFSYGNEIQTNINLTATSEWQRVVLTGKHQNYNYLFFDIYYLFNGAADLEFTAFQVEKGTSASDYVETAYIGNNPSENYNTSAQARYSHDPETLAPTGLYLEPAATNLLTYSNFQNFTERNVPQIEQNVGTAPDGTNTAIRLNPATANTRHLIEYSSGFNNDPTFSVFVKGDKGRYISIGTNQDGNLAIFDTQTGTITDQSTGNNYLYFKPYPNGWYRLWINRTSGASWLKVGLAAHATRAEHAGVISRSVTFTGDPNLHSMFIWGGQLEASQYPSSYISTSGSTVTRAADVYTSTPNLTETFEPRGLMIEEARTNFFGLDRTHFDVLHFRQNGGTDPNVQITAPDGTNTAQVYGCSSTAANTQFRISTNSNTNFTAQQTVSFYAKKVVDDPVTIHADFNDYVQNTFVLTNEWKRYTLTAVPHNYGFHFLDFAITNKTGDQLVALWGAQLEIGSFATSYIYPTANGTSVSTTRSADVVSISDDNFGTYRTNLIDKSNDFDNWNKMGQSTEVKAYCTLAPDNTFSGHLLYTKNTQNQQQGVWLPHDLINLGYAGASGAVSYFSAHVKQYSSAVRYVVLRKDGSPEGFATFDFQTESFIYSSNNNIVGTVENVGNGWYRIKVKFHNAQRGNPIIKFSTVDPGTSSMHSYAGNVGEGLYVWGAQLTLGSEHTNYIPSTNTFTSRLGNATYVDSNGLIKTAYRNYLPYSNVLNPDWVAQTGSFTFNNAISPDGTQNAAKFIPQTSNSGQGSIFYISKVLNGALSIHAKAAGFNYVTLIRQGGGPADAAGVSVNLTNGSIHHLTSDRAEAEVIDVGTGWYRIILKITDSRQQNYFVVNPHNGGTVTNNHYRTDITGDGSSGILVWGAMQTDNRLNAGDYYPNLTGTLSGAPRYSHDPETLVPTGLYLEEQILNKAPHTETFSGGYTSLNSTFTTDNNVTNPDGSVGAKVLTMNSTTAGGGDFAGFKTGTSAYNLQTASVFVKKKTARYVTIGHGGLSKYQQTLFDFDTESIITAHSQHSGSGLNLVGRGVTKYPNGWYRIYCITSGATGNNGTGFQIVKDPARSKVGISEAYDGTEDVYIWGFNITDKPFISSYIPNFSGSTVTKVADTYTSTATTVLDRDGGNKESFNNIGSGTAYIDHICNGLPSGGSAHGGQLSDGNSSVMFARYAASGLENYIFNSGSFISHFNTGLPLGEHYKAVTVYKTDDMKLVVNGSVEGTDTSGTLPTTFNALSIGKDNTNQARQLNGTINRLTFWKSRLPDASLTNITT